MFKFNRSARLLRPILPPIVGALVFHLVLCSTAYGQGQAAFASLSGDVRDASGAAIAGASVMLSNSQTDFHRTFPSDDSGRYAFPQIPPGTYSLRVEQKGFRTYVQNNITLTVGESATQAVLLSVGEITQEIVVNASASQLNTSNANLSADVSQRQVTQLPLDYRAPFFLVTLLSSVNSGQIWQSFNAGSSQSGPGADQDASAFTFGGSRFGSTGFLLDGHWNGSSGWGAIMYSPTVDETEEFKIQQNVFTAQYGRSMGNVVNAITKSGSSELHGDVFEFIRNSALDANNFFNNSAGLARPHFERNQFGFTAGGPVYIPRLYRQRDKTFFFGGYEGLRQSTPLTLVTTVPTAAFHNGDFSALLGPQIGTDSLGRPILQGQIYNPFTTRSITAGTVDTITGRTANQSGFVRDPFPGNLIPNSLINPVAGATAPYYPAPTGLGLVNNFTSTIGAPVSQDKYSIRVDQNITDAARFFVRWSQAFEFKTRNGAFFGPNNPAGSGEIAGNNRFDLGGGFTYTFSPTFLMSVAAGVNRWVETRTEQGYPFPPSKLGLPSFMDTQSNQFPQFFINGVFSLGGSSAQSHYINQDQTASIDFSKNIGAHTFGFGYQFIEFIDNTIAANLGSFSIPASFTQGPDPNAANPQTGAGFASFLLGTGNGGGFPLNTAPAYSQAYHGWYVQDEWKISPKLTATIGLRYDIQGAPTERHDRLSNFDFTGQNPIQSALTTNNGGVSPLPTPGYLVFLDSSHNSTLYNTTHNNFAPRASLAYRVHDKVVIRSGFGMFYIPNYPLWSFPADGFSQNTPYSGTVNGINPTNLLSNPFPNGLIPPSGSTLGGLTNVGRSVNAVGRTRSSPYVEQWTFGVQYALAHNDSIEVSYVGNHGLKLPFANWQRDQLSPQYLSLGDELQSPVANPFYGSITSSSCGLDQKTIPLGQLLRPYPQYCGVNELQPLGAQSWYHGMTVEYNHRFSHGVQVLASYTWSKYLDNSQGEQQWVSGSASSVRNWYNLAAEKSVDANDVPHSVVMSFIAELPFGKGKKLGSNWNGLANAVLGGWQVSSVITMKAGLPLGIDAQTNNTNSFGGGQRPNISGDITRPRNVDPVKEWFNTAAFTQPAPFTFGNAPRFLSSPRAPGLNNWDIGISKMFQPIEHLRIQFRSEFFNAFNHANFYLPNTTFGDPGFGSLNQTLPARDIQFALKVLF
jgi:Carboxypeptidase regulatory-like domain